MKLISKINIIASAALFMLQCSCLQNASGQGQVNMIEYLTNSFNRYCQLVPREEIFVCTDREVYIAGEELWFSFWLTDRKSLLPSEDSRITYVELLDPSDKPVLQKQTGVDKGSGHGQFDLPDTLASGTYTLRAYTSRMKNFLPYNCFVKDIKIYNAFNTGSYKDKIYTEKELKPGNQMVTDTLTAYNPVTLKVNDLRSDSIEIFVYPGKNFPPENNNRFYLFIQSRGNIIYVGSEIIRNGSAKICLSQSILLPGISQMTIFDYNGQPVFEKYIYIPEKTEQFLIVHSEDSVGRRSKISLDLSIENPLFTGPDSCDLSISVVPVSSRTTARGADDYLIFGSEFGLLPAKILNGKNINELTGKIIDSLLMNISSNWIEWKSILSDRNADLKFQAEKEEHLLNGLLLTNDNQLAHPGEFLILSIPGKVAGFQYARTDNAGRFSFSIPIRQEARDMIIQPDDTSKEYNIYIESPFSDQYLPAKTMIQPLIKPIPSSIAKMGLNYQVNEIYGSASYLPGISSLPSPNETKRFYGKPDFEILMKDWVKLPFMEEVFFEIVPQFNLKRKGIRYEMLLTDPLGKILYDLPPAMMIDGVIVKDPAVIANLNPEVVEKIDVVKEQYMVGDYLFNGIVNVITRMGNYENLPLPENAIRIQYRDFDPVAVFMSPDYSYTGLINNHEPDFRNTLYWNPSVRLRENSKIKIEFWTADVSADYEIDVRGITPRGKVFSFRKVIRVK